MLCITQIGDYDHKMDTRQIEYAIAVAEELSFTRAAQRVFAVQSTISAGVRALESELGADLFERDRRGVHLTGSGATLLPLLREVLDAANRVRTAADPECTLRGELRVGIFANIDTLGLPSLIGAFHREHPLVDLRLRPLQTGSVGLAEEVRRGRVDIAFFGLPATAAPGLRTHRLASTRYTAVLPERHPLAAEPAIPASALADERFIDTPQGFGNRVVLDAALGRMGVTRDIATEVGELGPIVDYVAAGLGVAVLPAMFVQPVAGTVAVPLKEQIAWDLNVITRPRPNAAAEALLERLTALDRAGTE